MCAPPLRFEAHALTRYGEISCRAPLSGVSRSAEDATAWLGVLRPSDAAGSAAGLQRVQGAGSNFVTGFCGARRVEWGAPEAIISPAVLRRTSATLEGPISQALRRVAKLTGCATTALDWIEVTRMKLGWN